MPNFPLPVLIHVAAGGVAIAAGFLALAVTKGAGLHRQAGTVFFAAMVVMAGTAGALSLASFQRLNLFMSLFTLYLVTSAWAAARQPAGTLGPVERLGPSAALAVAAVGLGFGLQAAAGAVPASDPTAAVGAPIYFVFTALVLLAAGLDLKVLRRGGLAGYERLRRHVWRICLALFVAAASFFLGQQDEMPAAVRGSPLLPIPPLTALGALAWWMAKSRPRRRRQPA